MSVLQRALPSQRKWSQGMTNTFNTGNIRKKINDRGLQVDEEMLKRFVILAREQRFTQKQFEILVELHIDGVVRCFTRSMFTLKQRICLALYFLGFFKEMK